METETLKKRDAEEKKGKKRWFLLLLLLLLLLAFAVGFWALFLRKRTQAAPAAAEPSGGSSVTLTYSDAVSIDLSSGEAALLFANPEKSTWNAAVRLVLQDTAAAQSDVLSPGQEVTVLPLADDVTRALAPGSLDGKLLVSFYDPQSGEKAMLDAEIPVTVTVTE